MTKNDVLNLFTDCFFDENLSYFNKDLILDYLPHSFNYDYDTGATKLVIIPENEKFVIKIPFKGKDEEIYDEEYEEYNYEFFKNLYGCRDRQHYWDYCLEEVLLYRLAKQNHVEKAFCKTVYIGDVQDYPIYIQQKASLSYDKHYTNYSDEIMERARRSSKEAGMDFFAPRWQTNAFEYYGKKQYQKLMSFIKNYGIDDLHGSNIGYLNDRPIIFDYSGYNE